MTLSSGGGGGGGFDHPACGPSACFPEYDICMCVVNKHFDLLEFVFDSVYVDLQYDEISIIFNAGSVYLCDVCSRVVVLGLSVRLSWYLM